VANTGRLQERTGDLELVEIEVAAGAPAAGKAPSAVSFPRGAVVVADEAVRPLRG
jgi:trk system potassium uptake protein TrkA